MSKTKPCCLFTTSWDDGHPLDRRVAELLAAYDLRGTFYIPRSGQRPVMGESEIRALSDRFEIGGHTLDHVRIDHILDADVAGQLSGSRAWVENTTGKPCLSFCFPGGRFRRRQLPLVCDAGYKVVRTVELLSTAFPKRADGLGVLPTTIQVFPHGPMTYAKNALKRISVSSAHWLRKSLFSQSWTALASEIFLRTLERGGVFHLWGHSWEIEEQSQWKNLEQFLRLVSSYREKWQCVTNGDLHDLLENTARSHSAVHMAFPGGAE